MARFILLFCEVQYHNIMPAVFSEHFQVNSVHIQ